MNNKIFTLSSIFITITLIILIIFTNVFLVNPTNAYNYYPSLDITKYKFKYDKYTAKLAYEQLKIDKSILVFGTSRSAKVSNKVLNTEDKVLNVNGLYGNPFSISAFLNSLSPEQINNIKKVYYLVDTHTLKDKNHLKYGIRDVNYENYLSSFMDILLESISISKLWDSYECVKKNYFNVQQLNQYVDKDNGYIVVSHKIKDTKYFMEYPYKKYGFDDDYFDFDKSAITKLAEINSFFKKHNITVVYYTGTYSPYFFYNMDLYKEFEKYKLVLSSVEKLYFLEYIENISTAVTAGGYLTHFNNPSHLNYNGVKYTFEKTMIKNDYLVEDEDKLHVLINKIKTYVNLHK